MHPKFKEAQAKHKAASVVNARQLVDDLRLQVKHYKALSQTNSVANSDADSEDESEGDWDEVNGSTAAAANRDHCFSCVSSSITPSSTPIVVPVTTYLSVAQMSQMSDIPPRATTKQHQKIARKAKIALVPKQQIASYLLRESSSIPVSRKLPTQSRVHFCVFHSIVTHDSLSPLRAESVLFYGVRIPIVHLPHSLLVHRAHWPMNWGTRCLHQSSDIHLIPVGTPLAQTPYGLVVQCPAYGNSIAYYTKRRLDTSATRLTFK